MNKSAWLILILCLTLSSCQNDIPFDKAGWTYTSDLENYPNRDKMLKDLLENHKLVGLSYKQLIDKLGKHENYSSATKNAIFYSIVTDYGLDIDPVYVKNLMFRYDRDSIITYLEVQEHKN